MVALGILAFLVGFASIDSYYPPDPKFRPPPPFGTHVGALVGTETLLAISGALALLLTRAYVAGSTSSEEQDKDER